jgi:RNA polymerase sigma factor (sigma-70 family)
MPERTGGRRFVPEAQVAGNATAALVIGAASQFLDSRPTRTSNKNASLGSTMTQALMECEPVVVAADDRGTSGDSKFFPASPKRQADAFTHPSDAYRAQQILASKIEYFFSPTFEQPGAAERLLGTMPQLIAAAIPQTPASKPTEGMPPYLKALYEIPLLNKAQEQFLFRKMNNLNFCADRLRDELDSARPKTVLLDQIERLLTNALTVRNQIVRANLRLVVSIAKRLIDSANSFDDLVSKGNVPLIRAVEIFDFRRGTRFSTYATWAIRNCLYRATSRSRRNRKRFVSGNDALLGSPIDHRCSTRGQECYQRRLRSDVDQLLLQLDGRDRMIVMTRFGLNGDERPKKFREIAEQLKISTERVRQLLCRSLMKMRELTDDEQIELA